MILFFHKYKITADQKNNPIFRKTTNIRRLAGVILNSWLEIDALKKEPTLLYQSFLEFFHQELALPRMAWKVEFTHAEHFSQLPTLIITQILDTKTISGNS